MKERPRHTEITRGTERDRERPRGKTRDTQRETMKERGKVRDREITSFLSDIALVGA